jgi:hypothetical protein
MRTIIIGLTGKKRHGKDSVAGVMHKEMLNRDAWASKRPLAGALKYLVARMLWDNLILFMDPIPYGCFEDLLDAMNTDGEKELFRSLLQVVGTDIGRHFDSSIWIRLWKEDVEDKILTISRTSAPICFITVPDLRFRNEAKMIRDMGGFIVKVVKTGAEDDGDGHVSETEMDSIEEDFRICAKAGDMEFLKAASVSVLDEILADPPSHKATADKQDGRMISAPTEAGT